MGNLYNSHGDHIVVMDLDRESAYPSKCAICGVIYTYAEALAEGENDENTFNVVIYNHTLHLDLGRGNGAGIPTSVVTCKGCAYEAIENYFHKSTTGPENLRRLLAGS